MVGVLINNKHRESNDEAADLDAYNNMEGALETAMVATNLSM